MRPATMVQYHALGLLYQIKQKDRMAVTKMVQSFGRGALRSPLAQCMHLRYAVKVMEDEEPTNGCAWRRRLASSAFCLASG